MPGPLCVSIFEPNPLRAVQRLQGLSFAELRLDAFGELPDNLEELVGRPQHCVLTCRPRSLDGAVQQDRLEKAVRQRPDFIDLDLDAPLNVRRMVLTRASEYGVALLLSKHWYGGTPAVEILERQVAEMLISPAAIVKVAAQCWNSGDLARLLGLYETFHRDRNRLIVLGMGPQSSLARLVILQLGAPFTFVAPDGGPPTARGQLPCARAREILTQAGLS